MVTYSAFKNVNPVTPKRRLVAKQTKEPPDFPAAQFILLSLTFVYLSTNHWQASEIWHLPMNHNDWLHIDQLHVLG